MDFPMRNRTLARLFSRHPRLPFEARATWPPQPEDLRLEGERIRLRWPRLADADGVFSYASDEAVSAFMDWSAHQGIEESRRFLYAIEKSRAAGREAAFAVVERETDELCGICSLVSQSDSTVAELGYALRRTAWGKGYMTEAVRLICPWAFSHLRLKEIYAEVHPENRASQRVLEKSGFSRHPEMVYRVIKGVRFQHYRYRLLQGDPPLFDE
jgi:ribosomal-protein-alanine N-acetyltransferase